MSATRITLQTQDGQQLAAYRHDPARAPRAQVVFVPGMAIPQRFYATFAAFLAGQGYRVWTFDYRGMGESRQGPLRRCKADITTWIALDLEAVVQHATTQDAALPLFLLGHSLGGQTAPLLPSIRKVAGLVNIAVGSGATRHNHPRVQRTAPLLWYVLAPLLCRMLGYFPGKRLGILGDIPSGAMMQWRRWCLTPDYLLAGEPGAREAYASASFPVLGLTFSDDELLHESGSRMLHEAYTNAKVDYRVLSPGTFNQERIGHFGFFRPHQEKVLWPMVGEWLDQHC